MGRVERARLIGHWRELNRKARAILKGRAEIPESEVEASVAELRELLGEMQEVRDTLRADKLRVVVTERELRVIRPG